MRRGILIPMLLVMPASLAAAEGPECQADCEASLRACQIVTVTTSWDYPFVYASIHEECLPGQGDAGAVAGPSSSPNA